MLTQETWELVCWEQFRRASCCGALKDTAFGSVGQKKEELCDMGKGVCKQGGKHHLCVQGTASSSLKLFPLYLFIASLNTQFKSG